MPKLKSKKSATKRFKKTASGYKHRRTGKSHILTKKGTKRKVQLRGTGMVSKADKKAVDKMVGEE